MNNIVLLLIRTVQILSNVLSFAILARVLLSWVKPGAERQGALGQILYDVTEPVIDLARKLPHRIQMIDLSPIIALFAIDIISFILLRVLQGFLI